MKFGICNEIFAGWRIEDVFAHCARLGYDEVELAPYTLAKSVTDLPPAERRRIRTAAAQAGIAIAGLHWVLVQTEGLHLTSPEAETRARTCRYFNELVACCADLGGRVIVVGSPKHRSRAPGVSAADATAWLTEILAPAARSAGERGVTLCLEPLPAEDTNFLNTARETLAVVRAVGSPHLRLILDVRAMSHEAVPVPELIREMRGEFAHFHANDVNLKGPGFGAVDFAPIAAALRETGYAGTVSVEVFNFDEGPEEIARRSLDYLRRTFAG